MRKALTEAEKQYIYQRKMAGSTLPEIAKKLNCSVETAKKWWRHKRDGKEPRGFAKEVMRQGQRTWRQGRGTVSAVLDFVPVVGDVKNFIEGVVGTDLAGHKLSKLEQTLMIAGALLGAFTFLDEIADAASLARHAANDIDLAGMPCEPARAWVTWTKPGISPGGWTMPCSPTPMSWITPELFATPMMWRFPDGWIIWMSLRGVDEPRSKATSYDKPLRQNLKSEV